MKLSIVATLYRSAPYIDEFHRRASAAACSITPSYEIVFVNDGSPDDSLDRAIALSQTDPRVVVVDLSKNFGHHKAMMTGLAHALGERVFLIDSDLEEEPEWLCEFAEQMEKKCCDVVYGVQIRRKGGWFERWSGEWFYKLLDACTKLHLPKNVVTARLMTRRYVDALLRFDEREVFLLGLWHITGFDQRPHTVTKHSTSETVYTMRHKLALLVNSVTSFSNMPLIFICYTGFTISFFASIYTVWLVIQKLFLFKPLSGWTSVMASIWLIGGLTILFMGIIGIYLSKIFSEVKRRPYTIVRQIYGRS